MVNGVVKMIVAAAVASAAATCSFAVEPEIPSLMIDPSALVEIAPLALDALQIQSKAIAREQKHKADLAKRGVAEVPACKVLRYNIYTGGLVKGLSFDEWGEFYIDRRFVTDSEMETIKSIEAWIHKWFPSKVKRKRVPILSSGKPGVPVFYGFEDDRYQMHDEMILKLVNEFNADKAAGCGGTVEQAFGIGDLSVALVKSHMIEETGGNGPSSVAAWAVDPLQVNVPGDWGDEKKDVGLRKPSKRNEGTPERNIRAAIRYLSRKGFGVSGRAASGRPDGYFDGWQTALQRYNGRRDRTATDRYYSDEYAARIIKRAANPSVFVPIEIKLAK